jgi:hypothetical protein
MNLLGMVQIDFALEPSVLYAASSIVVTMLTQHVQHLSLTIVHPSSINQLCLLSMFFTVP